MIKRVALVVTVLVSALAPTLAAHASASLTSTETRLAYLQNRDRTAYGRPSLRLAPFLSILARAQAKRMAAAHRIWHDPALPGAAGDWDWLGDNVGSSTDIENLHTGFLASREHRENLLFWEYEQFGVGVVTGSDGRVYGVVIFFTQHRGVRRQYSNRGSASGQRGTVKTQPQTIDMLERVISLDAAT